MHSIRRASLAVLFSALFLFVACLSEDAVEPVDPNIACADRDTVDLPVEPGPVGTIRTWAGNGMAGFDGDCNPLLESSFYWPIDIEFTANIGTYIVDHNNHRIRRITAQGRLETVVGANNLGDGPADVSDTVFPGAPGTKCRLNHPTDVFERSNGTLAIVSWHNHKIREFDPTTNTVFVTIGREANCTGDGNSALTAKLNQPAHAVEGPDGSIYVLDQRNQVVRRIDPAGNISTVVGTITCPTPSPLNPGGFEGDNGDPLLAKMKQPTGPNPAVGGGITVDANGVLYFADMGNHRIRRVDFVSNEITTVVGNGIAGFAGDNGAPIDASLKLPVDIEFGPDGRLYIADSGNGAVRAVDFTANTIVTIAGTGVWGFSGDGGPASSAQLANPQGVGFDANGDLFIADTFNHRIRRVKMQ